MKPRSHRAFWFKKTKKKHWCNVIRRDGCEWMLAEIMSIWPPIILTCICLLGNNGLLWSHATLFCSCLPGKRMKWEHKEKSEYSSVSAWRFFVYFLTRETIRTWDLINLLFRSTNRLSLAAVCLSRPFWHCVCLFLRFVLFLQFNSPSPPPDRFCHLHTNAQNTPLQ